MNFNNNDKALLLNNGASALSSIILYDEEGNQEFTFKEDDFLVDWTYEDYRYVPEHGFIGEFVERIFDGTLLNVPDNISLDGKEINPQLGISDIDSGSTNYYSLGTFIVTNIGEKDKDGSYHFESADYGKKFNVPYVDFGKYPCLTLELLNNVCKQVNVDYENDGMCICFAVPGEGIQAGDYCFKITDSEDNDTYYEFTLSTDLSLNDSLMLILSSDKLIQKRVVFEDEEYKVIRTEIPYTEESSSSNEQLLGSYIPYYNFVNNDFVVADNQFDEDELCRDVVKAVAKTAYTWARIGVDDRLHLDFTKKTVQDVDTYDIIDVDKYYENMITGDMVKPVNKVLIGMSQVDGENVYATSQDYTEETESTIRIYDNPLTHNELLRKIALNGCEVLYGITYTPISIDTIGHPWLNGDSFIKLTNLSGDIIYSYAFDRKIEYKGYINTSISSTAENQIKQTYEYNKNMLYKITKTEIDIDKANDRIDLLTSRVEGDEENVTSLRLDITSMEGRVEHIETDELGNINSRLTQITSTTESIQNLFQITGGSNLIKNSAFLLDDKTWLFEDIVGKNIFNKNNYTSYSGYVGSDGILYPNAPDYCIIIPFERVGTFTFSFNQNSNRIRVAEYNELTTSDYSQLTLLAQNSSSNSSVTFTTSSNCKYLYVGLGNNSSIVFTDAINTAQIEEGSTATEYEPYQDLPHYHTPIGQGYDSSLIGDVISRAGIQLQNTKMTSDIDEGNVQISLINTAHGFSYAYKLDDDTTGIVRLKDAVSGNTLYEENLEPTPYIKRMQFPARASEGEEQQTFLPINAYCIVEIETKATYGGSLYIYDLMLNSGDVKSWEPSSGEISSTILKMSTYGLQVTSTGSNISTLMSAGGFSIYPINSSGEISGQPITNFDDTGLQTGVAETTKVIIKKYVMDELILDNKEHHVEYFKES